MPKLLAHETKKSAWRLQTVGRSFSFSHLAQVLALNLNRGGKRATWSRKAREGVARGQVSAGGGGRHFTSHRGVPPGGQKGGGAKR